MPPKIAQFPGLTPDLRSLRCEKMNVGQECANASQKPILLSPPASKANSVIPMKYRLTILIAVLLPFIAMSQTNYSPSNPAETMRQLRLRMLSDPPAEGTQATKVDRVLMDWPMGTNVITVVSSSFGDASLYTTSTFGVIGGIGHDTVRAAAMRFIKVAESHYADSKPVTAYPYPKAGRVNFYLVCLGGVRLIEVDEKALTKRESPYSGLFNQGQQVLTELRLLTQKQKHDASNAQ